MDIEQFEKFCKSFNKYLNLISKFAVSCNIKGEFEEASINPKILFHKDYNYHEKLIKFHHL